MPPTSSPSSRIETPRLVVRCWRADDAPLLRAAVDESLEHLREWMDWALAEPTPLEETRARLEGYERRFLDGEDFTYGIFDVTESEVVGGCGLHPRIGDGGLEIGYWIRATRIGRGFATEAARALTDAAFGVRGIDRVQIHCDPANERSGNVARKLGFALVEHRVEDAATPDGLLRDTLVFRVHRDGW